MRKVQDLTGLNWEVDERDIMVCGGKKIANRKAIIRTDNKECLSVVGKGYEPLLNSEYKSVAKAIIGNREIKNTVYKEIDGGRRLLTQFELAKGFKVGGDEVNNFLTLINSHDGSTSFTIGFGNRVLSCANQFYAFWKKAQFKIYHTASLMKMVEQALSHIEALQTEQEILEQEYLRLHEIEIVNPADEAMKMVKYLRGVDLAVGVDRLHEEFKINATALKHAEALYGDLMGEMSRHGNTAWGLFNGVTYYTNHTQEAKDVDKHLAFGVGLKMNQEALVYAGKLG